MHVLIAMLITMFWVIVWYSLFQLLVVVPFRFLFGLCSAAARPVPYQHPYGGVDYEEDGYTYFMDGSVTEPNGDHIDADGSLCL